VTYGDDGTRTLKDVHLHEVSLVAIPENPRAQVVTVKSPAQIENVLRTFRPGEVTAADLDQLRSIDLTLKTLLRKDGAYECDCEECLAGDCADCSDLECDDPNCEGSTKARQAAEELAVLKRRWLRSFADDDLDRVPTCRRDSCAILIFPYPIHSHSMAGAYSCISL
jgi:hypothetical protein